MNVCIIPARGGSKRIPRKNLKLFHGRPIIQYSIELAQRSSSIHQVIVSTDDDEIADVSYELGAGVYKRRGRDNGDKGTQEVIRDCLVDWFPGKVPEYVCGLYATAPLLTIDLLELGYYWVIQADSDYALSVVYPPLQDAGAFYWGKGAAFLQRTPLIGPCTSMICLPPERVCDINTPEDWTLAEQMYLANCRRGGKSDARVY